MFKKGQIPWNKGIPYSEDIRKKLSESHKGQIAWNKGKPSSEETRRKISEAGKGRKASEETRKKMSGKTPWNKGKKGRKASEETRKRISESMKGVNTWTKGKPAWNKGIPQTEEAKKKKSESSKGQIPWNKGKKGQIVSEQTRRKISESMKGVNTWSKGKPAWNKGKKGQIAWNKGKTGIYSEETLKKNSEAHKGRVGYWTGKKRYPDTIKKMSKANTGKTHSEDTKRKLSEISNRPENIQKNREQRSKIVFPFKDSKSVELAIQKILTDAGIEFEKHTAIKIGNSYHQADILIKPNKIIEGNGDYWHFNPRKYHAEQQVKIRKKIVKVKEVWDKEELMLNKLRILGYEILVVWEYDLMKNLDQTTKTILEFAS